MMIWLDCYVYMTRTLEQGPGLLERGRRAVVLRLPHLEHQCRVAQVVDDLVAERHDQDHQDQGRACLTWMVQMSVW